MSYRCSTCYEISESEGTHSRTGQGYDCAKCAASFRSIRAQEEANELARDRQRYERDEQRVDRWWATYNAALTGMSAFGGGGYEPLSTKEAHDLAIEAANLAHGELNGK